MRVGRERMRGALILALLGYPDQAVPAAREGLANARETRIPIAIVIAELFATFLRYFMRDVGNVRESSEAALRLANEHGRTAASGYAAAFVGWVEAMQGDAAKGLKEIQRGRAVMAEAGNRSAPCRTCRWLTAI